MRTSILSLVLMVGTLMVATQPVSACMWDREVVAQEKEFKSSYLEPPGETSSPGQPLPGGVAVLAILVGLFAFFAAAVVGVSKGALLLRRRG